MNKLFLSIVFAFCFLQLSAQNVMTPEILLQLNKVSGKGISKDGNHVIYSVSKYNKSLNTSKTNYYSIPISGGEAMLIDNYKTLLSNKNVSPNGAYIISTSEVKLQNIEGSDFYNDVSNSNVQIYDALNYRHWDTWEDGKYSHIGYQSTQNKNDNWIDIMLNEPFDCPTKPFGGSEDYVWNPNSKSILYVAKKLTGTEYATSTNTDIYEYDLASKITKNLTEENKGYDTQPAFSSKGQLAWLQMKRDGYEADKNDIIIKINDESVNLTGAWDETVDSFVWQDKGEKIYFIAPTFGTMQLFEIAIPTSTKKISKPKQLTEGQFDVSGIVGQVNNAIVVSRRDMNHAIELYSVDLKTGKMNQLTHENEEIYNGLDLSTVEKRMVKTTDGKDMLTWVIYPPNFDSSKKYPTILYCKGGPQGPLSQSYSFRWNYQLMAANGYIIVAPSRRGMSGFGVEWNEQISKDYGGQNMQDYLSAIDDISKEPYVDTDRLGAVGASYGGYSVFYLAGIHEGRFKSFIAHDGMFNLRSMYGTTEELFFVNWDLGGNYWDASNVAAQQSFEKFNPVNYVDKWTTPILIIQGGKDYRVPIGQGLEAFQAAQLKGIKSKLLYFPEENHWVLNPQNSLVWQREFFKWLQETL
ncbi:S9 family peptidase [Lutibacter maritimus]|uniref:Dipeptidyl aminopeptidase/acylaminoacyl peptidase n=1 Tax=Lutibacter maritimus TaxID=593133 RepID=A0A1I6NX59_9FLAO|nr:S9 family peptidase [Lutibacter maritimus]SFS32533.1 Dipeptidyl aminopeptidase/acylaminoacyl peptidase [Lutibacter maritimus]